MKTVVHLTTVHYPFDNRIFHKECVSLTQMGYRVILVASHDKDEVVQGVEIHALAKPKNRLLRLLISTWNAYNIASMKKADIYHFHDPELIPVGLLLRLRGQTVIYDIHEDYVTSFAQKTYLPRFIRFLVSRVFTRVESFLGRFFVKVIAEKYYKKRFPDGIQILNYPRTSLCSTYRTKTSLKVPRLLYTGNISKDRGAVHHARIVNLFERIDVFMVGQCDAQLAEELYEIAGKKKEFLHIDGIDRFVAFEKILEYYEEEGWTAGLALFPSTVHYINKELTKFFEYMGAGIPVICSDFPVWRDLIQKTGVGICVDPNNEKAVAEAIMFLMNNPKRAEEMGQKGKAAVERLYNWENEAGKLHDLYESLLK